MEKYKAKICLAIADPDESSALALLLQHAGHEPIEAHGEDDLIDIVADSRADIAIIDAGLTGNTADKVCRDIRQITTKSDLPVIILCQQGDLGAKEMLSCFKAGANDCIVRPYISSVLMARINRLLRSHEYESSLRQQQSLLEQRVETQSYEIRRLQDLNREIVASIPSLLAVFDRDLKLLYANPTFYDKMGFDEAVVRNKHISDLLGEHLTRKDELIDKIRKVVQTEEKTGALHDVYYDTGPGRRDLYFNVTITPISGEGNADILLVLDDVTETIRRRDVMTVLRNIATSIQGTLELDRVLFTILTCATAGVAIGFSRAFLFLINEERQSLDGEMAVGPTSLQDAIKVWSELSKEQRSLNDLLAAYDRIDNPKQTLLSEFVCNVKFSLRESREVPVLAIRERKTYLITNAPTDSRVSDNFLEKFKCDSFVVVPMIARNRVVGAVLADNAYSGRQIVKDQIELMEAFVGQAALAVDSAESYRNLQDKVEKLATAYEDLRTAKERVLRSEQLATIGDMAARVAHEIRNPLVTIGGFARAINRNPDRTSRVKSNSWIIVQEVERLERILSNIMNFAKPPSPMFESHNINRLLDETLMMLEEEIQKHGIEAEMNLDESIPLIMIDAQQIKQVLLNLMHNAISALEGEGKLIVTTSNHGHYYEVHISDTGRGIPEELKEKIFTPFFTTKPAGTGLGLPIVKKIIDDHDGSITYHSTIGKGTTFVIRLPISTKSRKDAPGQHGTEMRPPEIQSDR